MLKNRNRFITKIIMILLVSFHMNAYSSVNYTPLEKELVNVVKKELVNVVKKVVYFGDISVKANTSTSSKNMFDDGDNASGLFGRLLEIVKGIFRLIITGSMFFGLLITVGGFGLVREANKNKLSPRIGFITIFVGITLGSPVACTRIAEYSIIKTDRATLMLEEEVSGNIQSNRE